MHLKLPKFNNSRNTRKSYPKNTHEGKHFDLRKTAATKIWCLCQVLRNLLGIASCSNQSEASVEFYTFISILREWILIVSCEWEGNLGQKNGKKAIELKLC